MGTRFQIGDGSKVSLWNDPWLPLPYSFKPFSIPMEGTEHWRVMDLIDVDNKEWLSQVINDLFTKTEAELILRIPLSRRHAEDRVIWHYDSKGIFSVKNAYHTTNHIKNLHSQGSSSSNSRMGDKNLWRKVWRSRVPPKVRSFVWKLLKGILPTRVALARKVFIPDSSCIFCQDFEESDVHLFMHCKALEVFWLNSFGGRPIVDNSLSLSEWIWWVVSSTCNQKSNQFFMCLWVVWIERNNLVWNGGAFNPVNMASWTCKKLEDFQAFHPELAKNKKRQMSKWQFPPRGRLKINFEGAIRNEMACGGIGVVVRDENGKCVAAIARSIPHVSSTIHAVSEACRACLLLASDQEWSDLELESNSPQFVTALTTPGEDLSEVGMIIEDCKEYMNAFNSIRIRCIFREANGVTLRLAHIASCSDINRLWLDENPSIIEDVLFEDACNSTRGSGIMSPSLYNFVLL